MENIIPDYVTPVIAWRCWRLIPHSPHELLSMPTLLSTAVPFAWPARRLQAAECRRHTFLDPLGILHDANEVGHIGHTPPKDTCTCGYYARKEVDDVMRMVMPSVADEYADHRLFAVGRTYMWGKVIEHEGGYRAQFAYPKSLTTVNPDDTKQLVSLYQCEEEPCTWDKLLENSSRSPWAQSYNLTRYLRPVALPPAPPPAMSPIMRLFRRAG